MNRKFLLIIPIIVVLTVVTLVSRSHRSPYVTAQVLRGPLVQEVLASGNIASPQTIDLQFQISGKIITRSIQTGDTVATGQLLAALDTSILNAQLEQSLASLDAQKAQLQSMKDGTRPEQIAVTQAQVESDHAALVQAQQSLLDAIKNAYTVSDSAVLNSVDPFFSNPTFNPKLSFMLSDSQLQSVVEGERLSVAATLSKWAKEIDPLTSNDQLAGPESRARSSLSLVMSLLSDSNTALNKAISNQQTSTAQLTAWMTGISAARASLGAAISALNVAASSKQSAASALAKDEKSLTLQQAGSTAPTLSAQEAQVRVAEASANAIRAQLSQARIVAPVAGTITKVNGEVGETVTPSTAVISMIPHSKLQIDVDLSEDAVAFAKVGDAARITLDAFGNSVEWHGAIVKIDPAQTMKGGAVYYKATVNFDEPDERVKPGMTANVWVETGTSVSTLYVPAAALSKLGAITYVQLLENGTVAKREVKTGLRSQTGMVEILAGLNEGDTVVTGEK